MEKRIDRRTFLGAGVGAGISLALGPSLYAGISRRGGAKRMLILGGTRFLGPPVVEAAQALGYEVTLFNRGKSNPHLFPDLEKRRGDRNKGDYAALAEGEWDFVVDTCGYVPTHVTAAIDALKDRVGFFVFISTVSVYKEQSAALVGEAAPLATLPAEQLAKALSMRQVNNRNYGALKAYCEQAAEAAMPGKVCNIRPGLIVGPNDRSDRYTYWPVRVARGGEIVAPGDGECEVQFVDVRDLGKWTAAMGAGTKAGIYNAVGFDERLSYRAFLDNCKQALASDCTFTWVPEKLLLEHKVRPYMDLPLWLPAKARGRFDNRAAVKAGLTFRAIGDTAKDTLAWHRKTRKADYRLRCGLSPEREKKLLAEFKQKSE